MYYCIEQRVNAGTYTVFELANNETDVRMTVDHVDPIKDKTRSWMQEQEQFATFYILVISI